MKEKRVCILFSGVIGCSKTPIANYLSPKLNLPIFNNDAVRTEVVEDFGRFDSDEHVKRRDARLKAIIKSGVSFICDASIDRTWERLKKQLIKKKYQIFIISLDLSKKLLLKLYEVKGYHESLKVLDQYITDHDNFLVKYNFDVSMHITDKNFNKRLDLSYKVVSKWLSK